jgi:putative tryptophan/tyrosine transport system substrate-binding protein
MNKRRKLIVALGASALAAPLRAFAQPAGRVHRLCWLYGSFASTRTDPYNIAFEQRLRELGFVEGRNLAIEFRAADDRIDRLPALAAELARQNCDVYFAPGSEAILLAIERASRDTPIVIAANDYDPVASGHIASLARPGGRITGMSQLQTELPAKRLEILKELLPKAKKIAVLADPTTAGQLNSVREGARRLGVALQVLEFKRTPYDYGGAFAEAGHTKCEALLALASAFFVSARKEIPSLALKHRLPSIFAHSVWADAGGMLSYGPNFSDFYRRAAEQVSAVLKGAKPATMPVEQPTKFELVINMKTAKALGVKIPQSILVRADKVIE